MLEGFYRYNSAMPGEVDRVRGQTLQEDLELIRSLYGFGNLRYGDPAERVKEEAIAQVRRDFRRIDPEVFDDAAETAFQRVYYQSTDADLATIDGLYGRGKLAYFATPAMIKDEALSQTSRYWEKIAAE